jgi:hypothetical protein
MAEATYLEQLSEAVARGLSARVSRRSALGRLGRGAIAVSLGGGAAAYLSETAAAHGCPCGSGCGFSVRCQCLSGGAVGSCPSGTCECGWWCVNDSSCPSGHKFWIDCCGGCNNGGSCTCMTDCVDGVSRPYCCHHKVYGCGCGTVGSESSHIKCRIRRCGNCTPGTSC